MKRENTDSRAQEPNRPPAPERRGRRRAFILVVVTLVSLATLIGGLSLVRPMRPVTPVGVPPPGEPADAPAPRPSAGAPTIISSSEPSPSATTDEGASEAAPLPAPETPLSSTPPAATSGASAKLLIPVAGVIADQLTDTYTDARSEGRTHNAIDIIAPRGTPVLAAADGRIVRLFDSERGGITIYQLDPDDRTIYYYAHLDRYADGLAEGHFARRGEVIGYVGDTGNSGVGNYHLHFSVSIISDPKRFWDGENINPYPLLK